MNAATINFLPFNNNAPTINDLDGQDDAVYAETPWGLIGAIPSLREVVIYFSDCSFRRYFVPKCKRISFMDLLNLHMDADDDPCNIDMIQHSLDQYFVRR